MENCSDKKECGGRREFLVKAAAGASAIVLSLAGTKTASAAPAPEGEDDLVLKLSGDSPLAKAGGSQVVDSKAGKVIVLRTADMGFVAYSAICTHKGGVVNYDEASKSFRCPLHGSLFDPANGNPAKGPAKLPLPAHAANQAVIVDLKPKA
jgi:Rieske Fe-S protein